MSAAPVTPIAGGKTPAEPETLRELYDRARADLNGKDPAALLRWVFWHAKAVGRLEVARAACRRLDGFDFEARQRALAAENWSNIASAYEAARPTEQLVQADALVSNCAAMVQAAASVVELLRGRR